MPTVSKYASYHTADISGYTNPSNAYAEGDSLYATAAPGKDSVISAFWGFDAFSEAELPVGSVIDSITFVTCYHVSTQSSIATQNCSVAIDGNIYTAEVSDNSEPLSDYQFTSVITSFRALSYYRSANHLQLHTSSARGSSNTKVTFSIEYVKITITYHAGLASTVDSGKISSLVPAYGFLYNFWAIRNAAYLANSGWHVATTDEFLALYTYLGGTLQYTYYPVAGNTVGAIVKEAGTDHWLNSGGTNDVLFNWRGNGARNSSAFGSLNHVGYLFTDCDADGGWVYTPYDNSSLLETLGKFTAAYKNYGCAVRLVKDSTSLSNGEHGTYTGNDGKVYDTVCINGVEWLSYNLCETQYRDKTPIAEVTDQSAWNSLSTGALCAYNNTWSNAFSIVNQPTVTGNLSVVGDVWQSYSLKVYIAGSWTAKPLKRYNGASWVPATLKAFTS
jgi:hypothetical protein